VDKIKMNQVVYKKRKAFTLVEMLIGFLLAMCIMGVFYFMHGTYQYRLVRVMQKSQGQQAVRLFLTKLRQELKESLAVYIPAGGPPSGDFANLPYDYTGPANDVILLMLGRSELHDHPDYVIKYEYIKDKKAIRFSEYANKNQLLGTPRLFLAGNNQILGFHAQQTGLNEQILTQKCRVDVEVEYFDTAKVKDYGQANKRVVPMKANLSVYPRAINMGLRIDVPQ
jgi:hypothetical protein